MAQRPYPFTAIVGQERMKQALILNAISSSIGGVLIRGERGTAKSTITTGLWRRCLTIRSAAPRPMSGKVLAVDVTTTSNSAKR